MSKDKTFELEIGSVWCRISDQKHMTVVAHENDYYYLTSMQGSCSDIDHTPDWHAASFHNRFTATEKEALIKKAEWYERQAEMYRGFAED